MPRRLSPTSTCILLALCLASGPLRGQEVASPPTGAEAAAALERALVEAIGRAEKSVVAIARVRDASADALTREFRPDPFGRRLVSPAAPAPGDPDFIPNDYGTGVVIDRRGLILTAYHVLGEESSYYVTTHDRKVYRASIKGADPRSDLAVLAIDAADLAPISLGDSRTLRKGQMVIALGNPYAIARDGQPSASWGIIANLGRKAPPMPDESDSVGKTTLHHFGTLIQTDARLNLGTSGGPLLNLRGEMIGLVTALAAVAGFEQAAGYAYPIDDTFRRVLGALQQGREVEYGFLGVQPENLAPREVLQGLQGTRVKWIRPGTPAYRYGLRPADVITSVNGVPIHDADSLVLEVGRLPVEAVVRLGVLREGRRMDLDVTLTKYPVRGKKIVTAPAPSWRGMRVDYPTAIPDSDSRAELASPLLDRSVIVVEVAQGTPAWQAGLRPGMLVSRVDRRPVRTPREFHAAVAGKSGPVELALAEGESEGPVRVVPPGT